MPRQRHRAKVKQRRLEAAAAASEDPHPLADPTRPIPNLACAFAFEHYYFRQNLVDPGREWWTFQNTLHQPLPVTFRVQPAGPLGDECRASLSELLSQHSAQLPAVTPLPWCSSFSVDMSKEALKASPNSSHVALQAWLAKWAALGALTRQAIESMVPVALLRVEPHHACLDLCASPGSKTTQAIEALYADGSAKTAGGFMVANDMSPQRCQMLLRRCAALGEMASRLVVTCHPAQSMPRLPLLNGASSSSTAASTADAVSPPRYPDGCYDRIICDVPCSGDGTTRKNPSIWHRWSVEYALEMHRLQLQIAIRAVSLIKVGGLVCYSTCSLNPLENESVVAELLRRGRGSLELVDCSDRLPELNRANGLRTWTVLDDDMREHASYDELMKSDELPLAIKRRFLPSMWPPDQQQQQAKPPPESTPPLRLERCLRLLPHLANMGGFFVALIRKVAPLPGPPPRATPHAEEVEPAEPPPPPPPSKGRQRLRLVPSAALSELSEHLGLRTADVTAELGPHLVCVSSKAQIVSRVADEVAMICRAVSGATATSTKAPRPLRIICAGCVLARRSRRGTYQPTIEGAREFDALSTKRRRLKLSAADSLKMLERAGAPTKHRRSLPIANLSPKAAERARALPFGPCLLRLQPAEEGKPPLTVPARRLRKEEAIRLQLLYTAGLEFRPQAILHSARAYLGA